ncbi:MAG: type II toxin-antitoxin system RelE/ParE family toxin [Chloroflexota bacterium]
MFAIRILKQATRELEKLDKPVVRRMEDRIRWLGENVEKIKPKSLKGEFAGLYKLREGDYRILYEIIRKEKVVAIHSVGHRKEIYKKK